jgi:myosin heavy subunit
MNLKSMIKKAMNLQTASTLQSRIRELQQLIEEKGPELSHERGELTRIEARIGNIQNELDKEDTPRVAGEIRYGRMTNQERLQKEAELRELDKDRKAAEKIFAPLQKEMDDMTAELNMLQTNPPKAELQDLVIAKRELEGLEGQIRQLEEAAERASKSPMEDQISELREQIDLLSADRDMMAADADMGKATPADLKKVTTDLNKLKKQLADLEETASLSESTQRGYQRHLDSLRDQHTEAERGYRTMISLYARGIYQDGLDQLKEATGRMERAIADITTASNLAVQQGDGESLVSYRVQLTVNAEGVRGFEKVSIETNEDVVQERVEQIVEGIRRQAA